MSFEDEFLANIAAAFGLPASALEDTNRPMTALETHRRQAEFERRQEYERQYWEAHMQSVYARIMFSVMIDNTVGTIVGYHPQRLLTDQRSPAMRLAEFLMDSETYSRQALVHIGGFLPPIAPLNPRDFGTPGFYAVGTGEKDFIGEDSDRRFFVHQTSTRANTPVRWGQAVVSPLEDLETFYAKVDADWGPIEMRALANAMHDDAYLRIYLDIEHGADVPGAFDFDAMHYKKPVSEVTSGDMRDKSYLKHDPSKQHRRRRRRK